MSEPEAQARGWFSSIRRIGESSVALIRIRLGVLAVELQEEKLRLLDQLVWLCLAVILGVTGLLAAMALLALWLWNMIGYWGLVALIVAPLAGTTAILVRVRRQIRHGPPPFEGTFADFRNGHPCLEKK